MRVKLWFVVVLLFLLTDAIIFVAAKVYWTSPAGDVPQGQKEDILSASPQVVRSAPPLQQPMEQACMNGATWVYDGRWQRWFKLSPEVPCKLGTVRSENDREGLIVRHPKGWRPDGG